MRAATSPFEANLRTHWPRYHAELQGLADGAGVLLADIVALNVRTEIAFGMFSDGCTSAFAARGAYSPSDATALSQYGPLIGQNWDWQTAQKENLIRLTLHPTVDASTPRNDSDPANLELPRIDIVTEAGLIGKIGLNSSGVGLCFNALRAPGVDPSRLPVHLGLRHVLEQHSAEQAAAAIESTGLAACVFMMIGDKSGKAVGLECSSRAVRRLGVDENGLLAHANHMVAPHDPAGSDRFLEDSKAGRKVFWPDSLRRQPRMAGLLNDIAAKAGGPIPVKEFESVFLDEDNYPSSICRIAGSSNDIETLFNIVIELGERRATVRLGRPCAVEETLTLGGSAWA